MQARSISSLDDLRREHPDLGVAFYAYQPGEAVTLEIHTPDGQIFTWTGASEAAVLEQAFPPEAERSEEPTPATDIFD